MRRFWSEQQLEHNEHEEQESRPLDNARKPFTAHQPIDCFDLEKVTSGENAFILGFEFGRHVILRLSQEWIVVS